MFETKFADQKVAMCADAMKKIFLQTGLRQIKLKRKKMVKLKNGRLKNPL